MSIQSTTIQSTTIMRDTPSRFSSNSEASASELLENIEEMFHRYYLRCDVFSKFKFSTTHHCVIR